MIIAISMFILFFVLLLLRVPISVSMGLSSVVALLMGGYDLKMLPLQTEKGMSSFTLMAIPFFIVAGNLLNAGGITKRIFDFSNSLVGHLSGGLAQVNVIASMIFSGISGTAVGDAAGLGVIEMKAMTEKGYSSKFAAAITLASSVVGPIIPPSVPFIIYAMIAEVSVAKLFLAGIVPGVVICVCLMITNMILVKTKKVTAPEPLPFKMNTLKRTFKDGILAIMAPLVILYSMLSGLATPTEAGVVGVIYGAVVGFIYKELTKERLLKVLQDSLSSTVTIMILIGFGVLMGWVVSIERIPALMAELMLGIVDNKYSLLLVINIILLILGMVMEGIPIKLILLPILLPIIDAYGIDRIHFGVLMTCNTLIGLSTPPVGLGLFVMTSITDIDIRTMVKGMLPFYVPLIAALMLITYVPSFTLWLPSILMP